MLQLDTNIRHGKRENDTIQTHRTTVTDIDRGLALPKIVAFISLYLRPAYLLSCSAMSRIVTESFALFVW